MRYKITLSYDGSAFFGWQRQSSAITVQETLDKALSTLLREDITTTGAGRTDSGVNAIGYVAHFDASNVPDADGLACKLNAILPREVVVHGIAAANDDFHARFDAIEREYLYYIHRKKDPFVSKYSWHCGYALDLDAMNQAASMLLGTRDFACFEKKGGNSKTSVCTITEARWYSYTPRHVSLAGYPASDGDYLVFRIRANRFLRNMVRAIVGTLIDVGRGKRSPDSIPGLLAGGDRSSAGESVPGYPLFLSGVKY